MADEPLDFRELFETAPPIAAIGTILLVEDNSSSRMVITELLEELGHRVLSVGTAAEALAIVERRAEPIDVVVTDIHLPDMLGHRLVQRIREALPSVPALYMSGYERGELPLGPHDRYLTKPFELDDLLGMVEAAIRRARGLQ